MKTIGIISGYFDPIHDGHLDYISEARTKSDQLVIIINSNKQALLKKGFYFQDEGFRIRLILNLSQTYTALLSEDEDLSVCKTLEKVFNWYPPKKERDKLIPIVHFKFFNGGDQKSGCREEDICKKYGCEVIYGVGGEKSCSSTNILKRYEEYLRSKL